MGAQDMQKALKESEISGGTAFWAEGEKCKRLEKKTKEARGVEHSPGGGE